MNNEKNVSDYYVSVTHDGLEYALVHPGRKMQPEYEELLYADDLKNGMYVLGVDLMPLDAEKAIYRNRWGTVNRIRIEESGVYFILRYDDGDMVIRQASHTSGWWVMKDSIPEAEETDENGVETHPNGTKTVHGVFEV